MSTASSESDRSAADGSEAVATIVGLFRDELGVPGCRPDDSFFRLGGDSLAASRVLAAIRQRYQVVVPLADMFATSTPAGLAALLVELRRAGRPRRRSISDSARRHRGEYYPLALSQDGIYRMDRALGGIGIFNSLTRLEFTGDVDPRALCEAIELTAQRQAALRTVFGVADGQPGQRLLSAPPRVRQMDLGPDGEAALRTLMPRLRAEAFDLHEEPAARFHLVRTAPNSWSVLVTSHHIAFDGMSASILADELVHGYQVCTGAATALPPLRADYLDFTQWQRETLRGDRLEAHLYQLQELLDEPVAPLVPAAETPGYRSRAETFEIEPAILTRLDSLATDRAATLFVVLVATLLEFSRRWTGTGRQLLTIQAANRTWPGSEALIGCFSNLLPVVGDLSSATEPAELVGQARASVERALRNEEMPFEHALSLLAERSGDRSGPNYSPQLGFVLQPPLRGSWQLPGCVVRTEAVLPAGDNVDATAFPLVLEFFRNGDHLRVLSQRLLSVWPTELFERAVGEIRSVLRDLVGDPAAIGR
ncbi:condensation domain-containing protein [Actinophytocola xanthii]|uniref:Carrier domain-containing protein n=1 Tax=Actinophytocola xanthii TaxID=1912961 RepID=A0A1Q8CK13_9PSEU|nr:condensation domain-containing protein [Actinophytocola xanthii]OLF14700.1 hypothetical protein BU204_25765 [Actinophytocola xanthii]